MSRWVNLSFLSSCDLPSWCQVSASYVITGSAHWLHTTLFCGGDRLFIIRQCLPSASPPIPVLHWISFLWFRSALMSYVDFLYVRLCILLFYHFVIEAKEGTSSMFGITLDLFMFIWKCRTKLLVVKHIKQVFSTWWTRLSSNLVQRIVQISSSRTKLQWWHCSLRSKWLLHSKNPWGPVCINRRWWLPWKSALSRASLGLLGCMEPCEAAPDIFSLGSWCCLRSLQQRQRVSCQETVVRGKSRQRIGELFTQRTLFGTTKCCDQQWCFFYRKAVGFNSRFASQYELRLGVTLRHKRDGLRPCEPQDLHKKRHNLKCGQRMVSWEDGCPARDCCKWTLPSWKATSWTWGWEETSHDSCTVCLYMFKSVWGIR